MLTSQDCQYTPSEILLSLESLSRRDYSEGLEQAYVPMPDEIVADSEQYPRITPVGEMADNLEVLDTSRIEPDNILVDGNEERESHYGAPQHEVDVHMQDHWLKEISDLFPGIKVTGEEGGQTSWNSFLNMSPNELGVLIDPVDGTTNMRTLRAGFASVLGLYRAQGSRRFILLGYVVTNATRETQLCDLTTNTVTMISPRGSRVVVSDEDPRSVAKAGTISIGAARGATRREYEPLFRPDLKLGLPIAKYGGKEVVDPPPEILTIGGAPVIATFPISELEYCVNPHDQTPYDAFPILGAVICGHQYYTLDGRVLSAEELTSFMSKVTAPMADHPRPVPPGLLVRHGANSHVTASLRESLRQRSRSLP